MKQTRGVRKVRLQPLYCNGSRSTENPRPVRKTFRYESTESLEQCLTGMPLDRTAKGWRIFYYRDSSGITNVVPW